MTEIDVIKFDDGTLDVWEDGAEQFTIENLDAYRSKITGCGFVEREVKQEERFNESGGESYEVVAIFEEPEN